MADSGERNLGSRSPKRTRSLEGRPSANGDGGVQRPSLTLPRHHYDHAASPTKRQVTEVTLAEQGLGAINLSSSLEARA